MFTGIKLTNKGAEMLAAAKNGETLHFSRIQVGSGSLEDGKSESSVTVLVSPVCYFPIAEANRNGNVVSIIFQMANKDITQAFDFREIGLFAVDNSGVEHLYAYSNAGNNAETIPLPSVTAIDYIMALDFAVSGDVNVTVEIDDNLVFASKEDVEQCTKKTDVIDIEHGGTGARSASEARERLGITLETIGAADKKHGHALGDNEITGLLPVEKGGTGANTEKVALEKLGAFPRSEYMGISEITGEGIVQFNSVIKDGGISVVGILKPVQTGSGDASPGNVRPISGFTGVKLTRCGKNILAPVRNWSGSRTHNGVTYTENPDGSISVKGTATALSYAQLNVNGFRFVKGTPYMFTGAGEGTRIAIGYFFDDGSGNYDSTRAYADYGEAQVVSDISGMSRIYLNVEEGVTVDAIAYPQCEINTVATNFEPYMGDMYAVDFGRIIYGGAFDWNTGVLTAEWEMLTLTGDEVIDKEPAWATGTYHIGGILKDAVPADGYGTIADIVCSHGATVTPRGLANGYVNSQIGVGQGNGNNLYFNFGAQYDTSESASDYLATQKAAGTPVQIAYKLNDPIEIQFEAISPIKALKGMNTVCGDAGLIEVYYNHDTPANIGAVNRAGDKMTGPLWAKGFTVYGQSPTVDLKADARGITTGFILVSPDGQISFGGFNPDQDDKDLSEVCHELYRLPAPSAGLPKHEGYDILTTKNPAAAVEALWAAIAAKIEAMYNVTKK